MAKGARHEPVRTYDTDGAAIVLVPIASGKGNARIHADDFDTMMELGFLDRWHLVGWGGGGGAHRSAACPTTAQTLGRTRSGGAHASEKLRRTEGREGSSNEVESM
jgi:hypothetical protein